MIAVVFALSGCKYHLSPAPVLGKQRLVKTDMQSGTSYTGVTYEYNSDGSYSQITTCHSAAASDCLRNVYTYDAAGRVAEVNTFDNFNVLKNKVVNTYDAAGMMAITENTSYALATPSVFTTTYTHDAAGNTTATSDGGGLEGSYSTLTYDSANRLLCDRWNHGTYFFGSTCYTYDAAGVIIRTDETNSGGGSHAYHSLYEYDTAGKLIKINRYNDVPVSGVFMAYTEYYYNSYGNISYELLKAADGTLNTRKDYTYETVF